MMQPAIDSNGFTYDELFRILEEGNLEQATDLLESEVVNNLSSDLLLALRIEAIQVAIFQERYDDALRHAEAALKMAEHEPLIHHLAGRAMWETGNQRTAAESFVYAAELLEGHNESTLPPQCMADPSQIFFMAAEACRAFSQHAEAMDFYQRAERHAMQ